MRKLVLAAVLVLMAGGAQAAALNVVGGQLMGASDVLVDGSLYDVQFLDGTCIDLFNGCDDASDFTFQTQASAILASQALLDQVFLDSQSGLFDTVPDLTNGCTSLDYCSVATPYPPLFIDGFGVPSISFGGLFNHSVSASGADWAGFGGHIAAVFDSDLDINQGDGVTYGVWSVSQVPEPNTALLLGLGLTGLAGKGRRRPRHGAPPGYLT